MSLNFDQSILEYFPSVVFVKAGPRRGMVGGRIESLKVFKKDGINGIYFDLFDAVAERGYRFRLGKYQVAKRIDSEATKLILERFSNVVRDEEENALVFESPNLLEVLKLSREVYDFIVENKLCYVSTRISQPRTSKVGWFHKRSMSLKALWENEDYSLVTDNYRSILGDNDDDIFFIGRSRAAARLKDDSRCWREHIVPLSFIRDRVVELLEEGVSATELADFLFTHVRVVLLTNEERLLVDAEYQTTMPDGWEWYGDKFARLRICGIELE